MRVERKQRVTARQVEGDDYTIEDWHEVGDPGEPAFENGWTNYGSGWQTVAFRKDSIGRVFLKGLAKDGTSGSTIFTLPVGYRPAYGFHFPGLSSNTTSSNGKINSDGISVMHRVGNTTYFSLDNVMFYAEY